MRVDKVNVRQGTDSRPRFSNGNTLPLTALPHGFCSFAPQTEGARGSWFFHPSDRSLEGVRLTHQPSPWIGDFSWLTFMPQAERPYVSPDQRWSGIRPEEMQLFPHYLDIRLLRYGARIRLAPTESGAVMALDFDSTVKTPRFAVTPDDWYGEIQVDPENREIYGFTTSKNPCVEGQWRYYFLFQFDCDISDCYVTDGKTATSGTRFEGNAAGANVALGAKQANVRLATSYVSLDQARRNLRRDPATYEAAKNTACERWEALLSTVDVQGDAQMEATFYSCLYRAFLYPTKFYELDENDAPVHVDPNTGRVIPGVMYTNNGFWDTYRTVYPLYSILAPQRCAEIVQAWLNFFDDTGYLPRWPSSTEIGLMPSSLCDAVLADAVVKGVLSQEDCRRALKAALKTAEVPSGSRIQGRKAIRDYETLGYVPYDEVHESVNETLDCAYGDYCIAQMAACLGETEIADKYYQRSKNYRHLFDAQSGFMRAKNKNGEFRPNFDPYAWGGDYTEGSAFQTSIAVQHDIEGLADLYGGKEAYLRFLDRACQRETPRYAVGSYGAEIHEMTEMAAVDFGQCAISNQPSFHMPYIYAMLGEQQKTVELCRELCTTFSNANDGFPGDEDNGTTAAWYLFTTLGFYPFCPGKAEYVVSECLFDKAVIHTAKGDVDVKQLLSGKTVVSHRELAE